MRMLSLNDVKVILQKTLWHNLIIESVDVTQFVNIMAPTINSMAPTITAEKDLSSEYREFAQNYALDI